MGTAKPLYCLFTLVYFFKKMTHYVISILTIDYHEIENKFGETTSSSFDIDWHALASSSSCCCCPTLSSLENDNMYKYFCQSFKVFCVSKWDSHKPFQNLRFSHALSQSDVDGHNCTSSVQCEKSVVIRSTTYAVHTCNVKKVQVNLQV